MLDLRPRPLIKYPISNLIGPFLRHHVLVGISDVDVECNPLKVLVSYLLDGLWEDDSPLSVIMISVSGRPECSGESAPDKEVDGEQVTYSVATKDMSIFLSSCLSPCGIKFYNLSS